MKEYSVQYYKHFLALSQVLSFSFSKRICVTRRVLVKRSLIYVGSPTDHFLRERERATFYLRTCKNMRGREKSLILRAL